MDLRKGEKSTFNNCENFMHALGRHIKEENIKYYDFARVVREVSLSYPSKNWKIMKKSKNQKSIDRRIGELLLNHRSSVEMTMEGVAGKLGISHQQYNKYEKGMATIPLARLIEIADIYRISVWDILEPAIGEEKPSDTPQQRQFVRQLPKLSPASLKHLGAFIQSIAKKT